MKALLLSLLAVIAFALATAGALACIVWTTIHNAAPYEYAAIADVPARAVAIVFGAAVNPDHSLSPMLADRVDGAVSLYEAGKVGHILMTGDNSTSHYDEPTAMKAYAVAHGVPDDAITLDYAGFDTYDSCYRAAHIFKVGKAVLVTQRYHLHRALALCRGMGIDAVGLALPDWEKYPSLESSYMMREYAADIKAWWELNVTRPASTLGGPAEPIK